MTMHSVYEFVLGLVDTSDVFFFSLGIWRESDQDQRPACHPSCHTRGQSIFFKETVSRDGYFFTSRHFSQCFLCMCWSFSRSLKSFSLPYTIIYFLFASFKLLTNFENAYWNRHQNSLLCDWSMFSSADLSLTARKMRKIYCLSKMINFGSCDKLEQSVTPANCRTL